MHYLKRYTTSNNLFTASPSVIEENVGNVISTKYCPYSKGLIFWLDGINKGPTADAWTDLVGGYVFTNNGCTALSNGWQLTNTTSTYNSLRNNDTLSFGSGSWNTYTIEATYETTVARAQVFFIPKTASTICIGVSGINTYRFLVATSSSECQIDAENNTSVRGLHTVSMNYNGGLMDANVALNRITGTNYFQASSSYNAIGADSATANYSFQGNIYAIRIYNRLLTTDEMIHNQQIDIARFRLNL